MGLSLKSRRRFYMKMLFEVRRVLRPRSGCCVLLMRTDHYSSFTRALANMTSNVSGGDGNIVTEEILATQANLQLQSKARLLRLEEKRSVVLFGEIAYAIKLRVE